MKKTVLGILCLICMVITLVAFTACDVPSVIRGHYTGIHGVLGATSNTNWYVAETTVYTTGAWLQYSYGSGAAYRIHSDSTRATTITDMLQNNTVLLGDFIALEPGIGSVDSARSDINCSQLEYYRGTDIGNVVSVQYDVTKACTGYAYSIAGIRYLFVEGTECLKV